MKPQSSAIFLTSTIILLLISTTPHAEATRVLLEKRVRGINNKNLLLSSLYNPVHTPTPNPGTGSSGTASRAVVMEKTFAGRSRFARSPPPQTPTRASSNGYSHAEY